MAKGRFYIDMMAPIGAMWQENEHFPAEKGWKHVLRKGKEGCVDPTGVIHYAYKNPNAVKITYLQILTYKITYNNCKIIPPS